MYKKKEKQNFSEQREFGKERNVTGEVITLD